VHLRAPTILTAAAGVIASGVLFSIAPTTAQDVPADLLEDDHVREELGVNEFTAPSIEKILAEIELLRPIPYEEIRREIPSSPPPDRVEVALGIGALIAQGFALVDAQQKDDIEPLARALLKHARALSVAEAIMPRARSLAEKGVQGDWKKLREELSRAQGDAERAMMQLRDEEIAHLISIGGWIRALEICSTAVADKYTPERAAVLIRVDLLDYFIDRLETLHPSIRKREIIGTVLAELKTIREMLNRPEGTSLYESDVKDIVARAKKLNDLMLKSAGKKEKSDDAETPPETESSGSPNANDPG
jgi:hypothetical protein